ncbi:GTP 3',8-cyclase MoaA [Mailhella massiliensis]|uniref:GTP 3',8-cyclase MoaA n=1 Tax=Mailhella massiliensis TaxID=1903261 RepID=A0A921DR12_9BACT|nr:GTP 3',8-cyclase MoaA [Mailhella massiliensis]HJD96576.1 GTP 3',8-cyclase MoaA [Mailhella massiliensis]
MPEQNAEALLTDEHGRTVRYLRISVTDRCNLCCRYCRDEDIPFIPHENILRFEEIEKIIGLAVELGVHKLRFTGGEPFARKGFLDFLTNIHERFPHTALKLTTNGTLLAPALDTLKKLGVSVNLSLDTMDREKYASITGRDMLPTVLENMHRMLDMGIPLKINAVAMRGVNDVELPALASLAMDWPVDVRFIEFMPMGDATIWSKNLFWSAADILEEARRHWNLEPVALRRKDGEKSEGNTAEELGPAKLWKLKANEGTVSRGSFGLITSVTQSFCRSCNRLRLTAEGNLRTCLFDDREYPIREALREKGLDEVRRIMLDAVARKPVGAEILAASHGPVAHKRMSAIGG